MKEVGKITLIFGEGNEANVFVVGEMSIKNASIVMGRAIGAMMFNAAGGDALPPFSAIATTADYFKKGIAIELIEASEQ